jgi:hypothetical protein
MGYGRTGGDDTEFKGWPCVEELLRLGWACCCQNGWEKLPGTQCNKNDVEINTGISRKPMYSNRTVLIMCKRHTCPYVFYVMLFIY